MILYNIKEHMGIFFFESYSCRYIVLGQGTLVFCYFVVNCIITAAFKINEFNLVLVKNLKITFLLCEMCLFSTRRLGGHELKIFFKKI